MTTYLIFILTIAGIYAMLSLGLVTIWGQGGMVNLGLVGFFSLGAYTSALLTAHGVPIVGGWVAGAIFSGLVGAALTYTTRKMRGDYLAIVSLGFAEVIRLIAMNETWLTHGSDGISGIKAPYKLALGNAFDGFYLILVWAVVAITAWMISRLLRAPFGRALRAMRDDEQVAAVAGKPVLQFKLKSFFIGASVTGLAGAMYAHLTSYIAPDSFVPLLTIYIFLAATLGGYTRIKGALVGAVVVVALLELSRYFAAFIPGLNAVQIASVREMSISLTLIIVMQMWPDGLFAPKNEKSECHADNTAGNINETRPAPRTHHI
ncbi:branched-chain amino acid ABC transporter permease [Glaciimonas sp. PCH181]|uniref:branched-chain amino acid ABC transporter permease n=1 Tax=Glaciimonas sp. PCH181 TaxID=2133943 RepID=UPI000D3A2313|nr:branched-chain amino acid ABC transporter permease [Glaciimonas sp. PCH181]PUA17693.1 branched-chain amino acid ABC transporter permease [Glaciimonas sp. PCH181]